MSAKIAVGLPYLHLPDLLESDLQAAKRIKKAANTEGYKTVIDERLNIFIFFVMINGSNGACSVITPRDIKWTKLFIFYTHGASSVATNLLTPKLAFLVGLLKT